MTSISPNLSHLNSTFSACPVFHEVLTKHYNVKETVHVLKSMIPDLSTCESFLLFSIWINESALPMAPAPANSINTF